MRNSKFAGRVLLGIYMILAAGVLLWIIYGVYLGNYAQVKTVSAAAGVMLAFIILFPKLKKKLNQVLMPFRSARCSASSRMLAQACGLEIVMSVPLSRRMTAHLEIEASGSNFGFARHPRR